MKYLTLIVTVIALVSCKKDPPVEPTPGKYEAGIIILNEGLFQQNNSSMTFYSFNEHQEYQQVFYKENNRGLGDTANDMVLYDSGDSTYLVVAVDVSSQIEIIDAASLKSVKQIPVFNGSIAREPRRLQIAGSNIYSCNYDGSVSVISMTTKSIINTITVGANPDGMALVGTNLYVTNSGGLNSPVYDTTISVIDLTTATVTTQIGTRINCAATLADNEGDLYVISNGNYTSVSPALLRIDTQTNLVVDSVAISIGSWAFYDDWIYYYDSDLQGVYRYHTLTETFENDKIIDCNGYQTMYKLFVNNSGIYTADANGYVNSSTIRCYNLAGGYQYEFTAGLNATKFIFN
ncbi:MAG: hypothetical protein HUJ25_01895 [Crocinitomicaceae bacterium]|nr:hypothetical protein [Crocinitomicaceae bacterium]